MLHRVLPEYDADNYYFQRRTAISWKAFTYLLDTIQTRGWQTRPVSELNEGNTENSVFITFDDGYVDTARALEEIISRNMTATVFPVKDFVLSGFSSIDDMAQHLLNASEVSNTVKDSLLDGRLKKLMRQLTPERYRQLRRRWFGLEHDALCKPLFMSEAQLCEYSNRGIQLGIHGTSHRVFNALTNDRLKLELEQAHRWLSKLCSSEAFPICLPHGAHNKRVIETCLRYSRVLLGVDTESIYPDVHRRQWITEDIREIM
jgi:peptidoglycan/xylan/chitin deacetylase (PgdA/CDA1 family)